MMDVVNKIETDRRRLKFALETIERQHEQMNRLRHRLAIAEGKSVKDEFKKGVGQ